MIKYRAEIDGLRAVAVVGVLLFHAGFSHIGGGFVGVDVFFVISGFLITSLILKDERRSEFSFAGFYERRIRRLLPPLLPVLAFTWLGAFAILSDQQFADYLKSLLATLGFSANWYFLASVGYFDGPGDLKPLLHMWSLGVEEQYYLLFPGMILLIGRYRREAFLPIVAGLLAVSFTYALLLMNNGNADNAFYDSFSRFWELLVGSMLAALPRREMKQSTLDAMEIFGIALISGSMLLYTKETMFPGIAAVPPVLGTAFIIYVAGRGRLVTAMLKSKTFVGIGLISYALYLWHWPILVFIRFLYPTAGVVGMSIGLGTSAALSVLSFHFIEKPFRTRRKLATRPRVYQFFLGCMAACIAVIAISCVPAVQSTRAAVLHHVRAAFFSADRSEALAKLDAAEGYYQANLNLNYDGTSGEFDNTKYPHWTCSYDKHNSTDRLYNCVTGQAKAHNVLVLGDSIGRDTTHALRLAFPGVNFVMLHQSACAPGTFEGGKKVCFGDLDTLLKRIDSAISVDAVVFAFRFKPKQWRKFEPTLDWAKTMSNKVVVMGVAPVFVKPIPEILQDITEGSPVPLALLEKNAALFAWDRREMTVQAKKMAAAHDVPFLDLSNFYCPKARCNLWTAQPEVQPIYWDNQHLTRYGMESFSRYLREQPQSQEAFEGLKD